VDLVDHTLVEHTLAAVAEDMAVGTVAEEDKLPAAVVDIALDREEEVCIPAVVAVVGDVVAVVPVVVVVGVVVVAVVLAVVVLAFAAMVVVVLVLLDNLADKVVVAA